MKCCTMQYFTRIYAVSVFKESQTFIFGVIISDTSIYTMGHPKLIVSSFMKNSIGLKRVNMNMLCSFTVRYFDAFLSLFVCRCSSLYFTFHSF